MLRVFLLIISVNAPALFGAIQCIEADLILHEGNYDDHPYVRKALGGKSLELKGVDEE